ncbi:MAG: DUF3299 domain-containing protein [Planctomycetales bacterium]|nr:DUF3299 domain-containing protein [Planctomycetales bacterium]
MSGTLDQIKPEVELQSAFSETITYRTISRSAVMALILSIVSLLAFVVSWLLVLPVVTLVLGLTSLSTIRRYPEEYTGAGAALAAIGLSTATFLLAGTWHAVDYATEVPEGYSRISFSDLQPDMKNPASLIRNLDSILPKRAAELNGQPVFIKGYMHPGVETMGKVDHFILVPDMGTCCFGGQPKATDMIEVKIKPNASRVKYSTRTIKLAGKFILADRSSDFGELHSVVYHLEADVAK